MPAMSGAVPPPFAVSALLPIMGVVFVVYLLIGLAMPVLPLHVHQGLGLGTVMVGLVAGSQFAAAVISRPLAGDYADRKGAKRTVIAGLLATAATGLAYLVSLRFTASPVLSATILVAGRAMLGAGESFIITGALLWGLGRLGALHTGKVMSWVGTALYGAYAVGAPAGTVLYARGGFGAIAVATVLIPFAALALVAPLRAVPPQPRAPSSLLRVVRAVWVPGLALAVSGVGFAAITTFTALLFAQRGWHPAWLAFTALSVAFMAGRLFFGHLPDRIGGAKVALACVLIEAAGQALIWLAPSYGVALLGVTLTGAGYSLVYPGLGVEAIRRAPAGSRGLAMGAYTAFLDLSLGVSSPALGVVAGAAGLAAVFGVSALVVLGSAVIAAGLLRRPNLVAPSLSEPSRMAALQEREGSRTWQTKTEALRARSPS
jgi:MFS family permease